MAQIPNFTGIKPLVKPVAKPVFPPLDAGLSMGQRQPTKAAPRVPVVKNVVRPPVAPPTDERRLMKLRPAVAPPPAQFAFENIPRPANQGFAAGPTTPPNSFLPTKEFWADPTGYGQPLFDNFLSKILPSKERLDNSSFSYLNLLNPENSFTPSMIPGIIGSAVPSGALFNLAGEAIKETGLEDHMTKYGPLAVLGKTALNMWGHKNDPVALAKDIMPLFKYAVTGKVVEGLNDTTGLNWNPAIPAIYPQSNLGFVNPKYAPPNQQGTVYKGGPLSTALVDTSSSTVDANLAEQVRNSTGYALLQVATERANKFKRAKEHLDFIKNNPHVQPLLLKDFQAMFDAANRNAWKAWTEWQIASEDRDAIDRSPEAIFHMDNITRQKPPSYYDTRTGEEKAVTGQLETEYFTLLREYYNKHNISDAQIKNPTGWLGGDFMREERERIYPDSIEDHKAIQSLVKFVQEANNAAQEANIAGNESNHRFSELNARSLQGEEGAPTRNRFVSALNFFIDREKSRQQDTESALAKLLRDKSAYSRPQHDAYQQKINRTQQTIDELESRPPILGYDIIKPASGEYKKRVDSLDDLRRKEIEVLNNLMKHQPVVSGENKLSIINRLQDERKNLMQLRPDMYVNEMDYPSNLDTNFYSRINQSIKNQPLTRPMTGNEWMVYLNSKNQQLNQGELKLTGIANYLKPEQKYTKEQVLKFAQDNELKIASTVFFPKDKGYGEDYEWNTVDKIRGEGEMIDTGTSLIHQRLPANPLMPGGENFKRNVQVIMVGEQGTHIAGTRGEGHEVYNKVNKPIGRLEVEGIKVGDGETMWLHEIQGPKRTQAKDMPNFLKFDNQGVVILLKRLLQFAYKNGYKHIQWTNGETQMRKRGGREGLGKIYDLQLVQEMNKIISKTGIKMDLRARPDLPNGGMHPWLDLTSPAMQKFLSEGMPVAKIFPKQGEEQRSIT